MTNGRATFGSINHANRDHRIIHVVRAEYLSHSSEFQQQIPLKFSDYKTIFK